MPLYNSNMPSSVIGTGHFLPKRIVENTELSERLGTPKEQIVKKTGIYARHWAALEDSASSLAIRAAQQALASADVSMRDIDLILVSTTTPDMYFPSTACLVQKSLTAKPIPAFDINASCSGFLYLLSIADQYLKNGSAKQILAISTEVKSRFINPSDETTAILFGDGAGAVVMAEGERGFQKISIGADGSRHRLVCLPGGGSRQPITSETLAQDLHTMEMNGKGLFRMAVKTLEKALLAFQEEASFSFREIDHFIFHQANRRILEALYRKLDIPSKKALMTLSRFGNTSSSSIPIALNVGVKSGRIKKGDRLLLAAFGGGLTWGCALLDW
ncbi:MAG: 3-oxoacyl-ACP synthase III family protein [Nitrospiria bacterium]